ncbi:MAG: hypothetical protein Q8N05_12010 [Bacteroidota bacterium]|nr:hypothetical protein [Bacteroidota bacterium]
MLKGYFFLLFISPLLSFSQLASGVEKETLVWIIIVLIILLLAVLGYEIQRFLRKKKSKGLFSYFRNVKLDVILEKDRLFRPQVLILTIRNIGKNEADIDAPVLEFRKIWTTRKFKLNGKNGNQIYPMYIGPDKMHQLNIETSSFHQYDREIKSYYWARILVSDVEGRKWKSNKVKLRKSLVT